MNSKRKRGALSKMGITAEKLISEFISGITLREIARKYYRTDGRISQIIRKHCTEQQYEQFKKKHSAARKTNKLNKFVALAKELGRVPSLCEAINIIPNITTDYYEFRKAAESLGFIYNSIKKKGRHRKYTMEQLLDHLKELANNLGHTPSCNQLQAAGKYTHNMYITCFGSLQAAQKLAGLKPNNKYNSIENASRRSKYVSKEKCIEDVKRLHLELGGPPSVAQLKEHGKYSISMYYSRLGGIKKMREFLELKQA